MRAGTHRINGPDNVSWRAAAAARAAASNSEFRKRLTLVGNLLKFYDSTDVAISLGVSELFLPNIASSAKHVFVMRIFASIEADQFGSDRIASYPDFVEFMRKLYEVLPEFPMLEDFVPEPDWGAVRVRLNDEYVSMFYGSSIERTPDFVEAFRITYGGAKQAVKDMDLALSIQRHALTQISAPADTNTGDISPGDLVIPTEDFWDVCCSSLRSTAGEVAGHLAEASAALTGELGSLKQPITESEFADMCMRGNVWPFLGLNVQGMFIPTSIRNGPAAVLDHWATHSAATSDSFFGAHARLSTFVSDRFEGAYSGPLRLRTSSHIFPLEVSVVMPAKSGIYVIAFCTLDTIDATAKFVRDFRNIVDSGKSWGIVPEKGPTIGLQNSAGELPRPSDIKIIIVLAQGGTGWSSNSLPEAPARLMPLADFITIFDSLENLEELERFWKFVDQGRTTLSPFSQSQADMFASFRDMNEVLVDGAVSPTFIFLDPHWNSSWRYRELCEFWSNSPIRFPGAGTAWNANRNASGVIELYSKSRSVVAYSVDVGRCTVQFVVKFPRNSLSPTTNRIIDLFAQAIADRLQSTRGILAGVALFSRSQLVIECCPDPERAIEENALIEDVRLDPLTVVAQSLGDVQVVELAKFRLFVSPLVIQHSLDNAKDASFEVEALIQTIEACSNLIKNSIPEELITQLRVTSSGPARFYLQVLTRTIDVPDFQNPIVPSGTEYKLARRMLAVKLQGLGFTPGRYELAEAKVRLDSGRNALREHLENRIATLDASELIQVCIEQNDQLLAKARVKIVRAQQSMNHEVDYDRIDALTTGNTELMPLARHYRYLLEKVLSSPSQKGIASASPEVLRELIGLIDWYMVLAGASDVLHNEVDVGGVEIDESFIPEIFYSKNWSAQEQEYAREIAKTTLGIDIDTDDAVEGDSSELLESNVIREAFIKDAGFDLRNLLNALRLLSQWVTRGFGKELSFSYIATAKEIAEALKECISDISLEEANIIVTFLTLTPSRIRHLDGKDEPEGDVPFWEHNKRLHRYAIRPLVPVDGKLCWGAEQASRTTQSWLSTVLHGYLPGDFKWKSVVNEVRKVKESIETELERRTVEICKRYTPFVAAGVDFFRRFKNDDFLDVGDFDALAYWPATNTLLFIECKYNQPAFSVKDTRRLRDRIFGKNSEDKKSQLVKIVGRRKFVDCHRPRMLELLDWPSPNDEQEPVNKELYISREIHWWMLHPPYPVPTTFIRVDTLDAWLRDNFARST